MSLTPPGLPGPRRSRLGPLGVGQRLALFYAGAFVVAGIHLPFWPVWLQAHGQSAGEIGLLLAAGVWARILANPLVADLADRRGERRRPVVWLAAGSLLSFAAFAVVDGFWALLAVSVLFGLLWSPIVPLGDSLTMLTAYSERLDYGRIRVWGSISFMAAAAGAGWLLGDAGAPAIYGLLVSALLANALICLLLPDPRVRPAERSRGAPLKRLLRQPLYLLFLVGGSLTQSSHAVYYAFSSLHWRQAGLAEGTIGLLWAEGVIAEIVLFYFSAAVLRRIGPTGLLLVAAVAAIIRWTATAESTGLLVLVPAQALHAFTFGAAHLGAMYFIARAIPGELSATAQSVYSATSAGLALGLSLAAAGPLFALLGGGAFHVMTVMALVGGLASLALARRWSGTGLAA